MHSFYLWKEIVTLREGWREHSGIQVTLLQCSWTPVSTKFWSLQFFSAAVAKQHSVSSLQKVGMKNS